MDLIFKTKKVFESEHLVGPGDHLLVAVSGGIDSMTLLHILNQIRDDLGIIISVAHVNYKLRKQDSDKDEKHVKDFCKKNNINFSATEWKGQEKGENLQEAARIFRYSYFKDTANKLGCRAVVLAHNINDQSETILLNLIRGTGLEGLSGMSICSKTKAGGLIYRPLLNITRKEIETFAKEKGIEYREDSTNEEAKYQRNFIRHKILPLIDKINPNFLLNIAKMAEILELDETFLSNCTETAYRDVIIQSNQENISINAGKFEAFNPAIRRRILRKIYIDINGTNAGLSKDHILHMDHIAVSSNKEGSYDLPSGLKFEKKSDVLAIFKN